MATNFPGSLDNSTSLPYPASGNFTNAPSLASGQDNQNDALIAVETKVGIGASTPTSGNLLIGTGVGTSAWTKAAPTGTIVGTTDSQTLTNKILTSPTINSPVITNANITTDAITGFSTPNTGTIYGLPIGAGVINSANTVNGASLVAGTVGSTALTANAVQANQVATNAITLGYTQITANFGTGSVVPVQVTGLTSTVTIPAGGRKTKITVFFKSITNTNASTGNYITIWDGVVGVGTQLQELEIDVTSATFNVGGTLVAVITPSAGSKTYNVGLRTSAGTVTMTAAATYPAFILVEAI